MNYLESIELKIAENWRTSDGSLTEVNFLSYSWGHPMPVQRQVHGLQAVLVCSLKACPRVERTLAKPNNPFLAEWVPKGPIQSAYIRAISWLISCFMRLRSPALWLNWLGWSSLLCREMKSERATFVNTLSWSIDLMCGFLSWSNLRSLSEAVCWNTSIMEASGICRVFSQKNVVLMVAFRKQGWFCN